MACLYLELDIYLVFVPIFSGEKCTSLRKKQRLFISIGWCVAKILLIGSKWEVTVLNVLLLLCSIMWMLLEVRNAYSVLTGELSWWGHLDQPMDHLIAELLFDLMCLIRRIIILIVQFGLKSPKCLFVCPHFTKCLWKLKKTDRFMFTITIQLKVGGWAKLTWPSFDLSLTAWPNPKSLRNR